MVHLLISAYVGVSRSRSSKIIDSICSQFGIKVEVSTPTTDNLLPESSSHSHKFLSLSHEIFLTWMLHMLDVLVLTDI